MSSALANTIGVTMQLAGVILLFRYGMPYRVASQGYAFLTDDAPDPKQLAFEGRYRLLGFLGLTLIIIGAALQIVGSWLPSR